MSPDVHVRPAASPARLSSPRFWRRYAREAKRPLHCLMFLGPWVILYELLAWRIVATGGGGRELLAHSMIQGVLGWFGIAGFWVPGVVLVVALVILHVKREEKFKARWWVPLLMLVESALVSIPLVVLAGFFSPRASAVAVDTHSRLIIALGAGIYEELVFRLLAIGALTWLLVQVAHVWQTAAVPAAAVLAAILFALCHFEPIGWDTFGWHAFWFLLVGGVYLSAVFVGRGLGIASGSHATYNVLMVLFAGSGTG